MEVWIDYCEDKLGAVRDYPFGPSPLVMKVGGKMFALLSLDNDVLHISLKCDPVIAENLREQNEAIQPGYHLNKKHWNTVRVDGVSISDDELKVMIDHSYELVYKSLGRSARAEIAEEQK